jgi:NitT/TauT family transport system ATP-binding protein
MQRFLLDVWRQFNKTILFVTHHVDEALLLSERIFLMTARPGMFVEEIKVDLPHPRDTTSQEFNEYRIHIVTHLEREVLKGFKEAS